MQRRRDVVTWGLCVLACIGAGAQQAPSTWSYGLKTGDHVVYAESLERTAKGPDSESQVRYQFRNHVLVLGENAGVLSVGIQRNRVSAELVAYREKGKDRLSKELPGFQQRLAARGTQFAEANEFSRLGNALQPWQAVREAPSRVLLGVHEIETLPGKQPQPGETWPSSNPLGFQFRLAGTEEFNGEACARAEGSTAASSRIRLAYVYCPQAGLLKRVEFEGEYVVPGDVVIHEKLRMEFQERSAGEQLGSWLDNPETQRGTLEALLRSAWVTAPEQALSSPLRSPKSDVQALALAVLLRRHMPLSDNTPRARLDASSDPQVRRLAALLTEDAPTTRSTTPAYPLQPPGTSLRYMGQPAEEGFPYILHVPPEYRGDRPFPLIIHLTGGGGLAVDGANAGEAAIAASEFLVLYPSAGGMWWEGGVANRVDALLKEILQKLNVDRERIYMTGFSNGGTGAMYYSLRWPDRFAATVWLMGAGTCMQEIMPADLRKLKNMPVLLVHGDDDPIIPASCSQQTYQALRAISPRVQPELHILRKRKHDITLGSDDGLTLEFVRKHKRCCATEKQP